MAAQATHHAPSGRFIKVYLLTWGLLAAVGLTYLASLAWYPELLSPSKQQVAEPDQGVRAASKALAEVGTVRRTVVEIQRDLGRLREAIDQREAQEKAAQSRLSALEERVTTLAAAPVPQPAPTAVVPVKQRPTKALKAAEPRAPTRIISVVEAPKAAPAPAADTGPHPGEPPKIETGSIAAPGPTITFGAAEVTPSTPAHSVYGVQLAAGPSLDSLRLSWSLLVERHGTALGALQPRFVPPRAEGGPYRLVAGPLPSKADADKVCADMRVGRQGCFSTTFVGEPL